MPTVLVIDDDRTVLHQLAKSLSDAEVITSRDAAEGIALVEQKHPDVVLLDIMLPHTSGLDVFQRIRALDSKLPVIFITAGGSSDTAIEAMKLGAYDYLLKPLNLPKVKDLVEKALKTRRLMHVPVSIPAVHPGKEDVDELVGRSESMLHVYAAVGRVAGQDVTVLIRGENGTGKELVARAIYQHSARRDGPFLEVNCAALPETLLESELFGHEKGAFTGADSRRIGKFEQCHGGTIFLDEVGDMAPLGQSKVLRLLQEQKFERVGGNETIKTDVRIITATNRNLDKMVEDGQFRADLFYRLNGFTIEIPPLRDRGDDIPLLIEHFLARMSRKLGKGYVEGISPEATELLRKYRWPGNVRELQSVIRQSLLNATGPVIVPEFLPDEVRGGRSAPAPSVGTGAQSDNGTPHDLEPFVTNRIRCGTEELYAETLELMERYLLTQVLNETGGNQSQASRMLGITRGSLRNKIRTLNISIEQVVSVGDEDLEEE
jgi:two-component system nitrogen regulation response regulator GlnG